MTTINALAELPEFMERIRHQVENDHDTNLRDELTESLEIQKAMAAKVDSLVVNDDARAEWQQKHELKSDAAFQRIDKLEKEKP